MSDWDRASLTDREKLIARAEYLLERGYILEPNLDAETLAERIYKRINRNGSDADRGAGGEGH